MEVDFSIVNPKWMKQNLKQFGLKQKELAQAVGADKFQVSKWLSGKSEMRKQSKCAVFYYFKILELTK